MNVWPLNVWPMNVWPMNVWPMNLWPMRLLGVLQPVMDDPTKWVLPIDALVAHELSAQSLTL
jgi:hypothetical protein